MTKITNIITDSQLRTEFEAFFSSKIIPAELVFIGNLVTDLEQAEALDLVDRWMDYIEGEFKEDCWHDFVANIKPKDLESMAKILKGFSDFNKSKSHKRQKEWAKYEPWLIEYFNRNSGHSLTDARTHCANNFGVSLSTIKRRTNGFKKPSS